jgi:hypothetical protein
MYLEYKMSGTMVATNKIYTSASAGMRMEMEMEMPQMGKMQNIIIMPKGKNTMYMLNPKTKTYMESPTNINPKAINAAFNIQVVGNEKVGGYNCVHLKVTNGDKQITDMWTTKDIAGYETMMALAKGNDTFGSEKVYAQLKSKGVDGMLVKTVINIGKKPMVNELVKAENRSNPASLFALPTGYSSMRMPKH